MLLDDRAAAFLAAQGLAQVAVQPLAADASARRYFRLVGTGLLLMDDRHDATGFAAFLALSPHLNGLGLSAPAVRAAEAGLGLALIEDWGHATYAHQLAQGGDESALYALAVDALLHLHHRTDATALARPRYDRATHLAELSVFCDWFAPAIAPGVDHAPFAARFAELWAQALEPVAQRWETLTLRDFHIDNLMELTDRPGVARCGLLDFQDALCGPSEYDLVSLLQDARRDLSPGLERAMLARYATAAPAGLGGADAIAARYALLGAQRHARIAGVFVRLARRDGKTRYLKWLPRVLGQLDRALDDAGLAALRACLDDHLPDWQARGAALATNTVPLA